jgi:hypothetical protein
MHTTFSIFTNIDHLQITKIADKMLWFRPTVQFLGYALVVAPIFITAAHDAIRGTIRQESTHGRLEEDMS